MRVFLEKKTLKVDFIPKKIHKEERSAINVGKKTIVKLFLDIYILLNAIFVEHKTSQEHYLQRELLPTTCLFQKIIWMHGLSVPKDGGRKVNCENTNWKVHCKLKKESGPDSRRNKSTHSKPLLSLSPLLFAFAFLKSVCTRQELKEISLKLCWNSPDMLQRLFKGKH